MSDVWVKSFTHLKDMPRSETALELLKKTASLVKPIMRKHGWVLPVLAEFFPDSPNLLGLNINMGEQILIRLRYAGSPDTFLPQEDLVGTMLHELTHNVHGPHDDKFYTFLSGLQDEYDNLRRTGYAGEGFFSEGRRLGENVSHNVPLYAARQKALEAAEKRMNTSRVLKGSGQRLGGLGRDVGLSPSQLAARAAEQRLRDEKACASGALALREAQKAAKASIKSNVIDLTTDNELDIDSLDVIIVEDEGTSGRVPKAKKSPTNISLTAARAGTSSSPAAREWSCTRCTYDNPAAARACVMCDLRRLEPSSKLSEGWTCAKCTLVNPQMRWSCEACESIKVQS